MGDFIRDELGLLTGETEALLVYVPNLFFNEDSAFVVLSYLSKKEGFLVFKLISSGFFVTNFFFDRFVGCFKT